MHSLHLLRSIDHRCEADAVLADGLVKLCIGRARHHIRTGGQSRESICDGLLHQMECFSVNIHRRRIIIGMQHFGLQTVFICYFFDDLTEEENRRWKQIDDEILELELKTLLHGEENREVPKLFSVPDLAEHTPGEIEVRFLQEAERLGVHGSDR